MVMPGVAEPVAPSMGTLARSCPSGMGLMVLLLLGTEAGGAEPCSAFCGEEPGPGQGWLWWCRGVGTRPCQPCAALPALPELDCGLVDQEEVGGRRSQ